MSRNCQCCWFYLALSWPLVFGCTLDSICWVSRTQFVLEAVVGLHTGTALNRFTLSEIHMKSPYCTPLGAPLFLFSGQKSAVISPLSNWTWWWCETVRNLNEVCESEWMCVTEMGHIVMNWLVLFFWPATRCQNKGANCQSWQVFLRSSHFVSSVA